MVRVEEELRSQRELMIVRFDAVDRRFVDANKRFEAVDKRFDDINKRFEIVDKRFDDINKRFAAVQWMMGIGFVMVSTLVTVFGILA